MIVKPFIPGEEMFPDGTSRVETILRRILAMSEEDVAVTLAAAQREFAGRHRAIDAILEAHFDAVAKRTTVPDGLSPARRLLIGAYFSNEYSVEAAALGNPSIVQSPDQSALADGEVRFIMTLRAIGEGHISSIEFRSGVIDQDMTIRIDEPGNQVETGSREPAEFTKSFFETKLRDLDALDDIARSIIDDLSPLFTMADLESAIARIHELGADSSHAHQTSHNLHWLAASNYRTRFADTTNLAERVIFPAGPAESRGMEDVRLVRFVHDDGSVVFYGTYTAYDGHQILPQLLETVDFVSFRIATLSGQFARNKGIALFPRKLDGEFAALGRHDNANNFLMRSNDVWRWGNAEKIQEPEQPWELVQLGNCGSPVETEAGWLVITHGVGPFRRYSLGALLLDLEDPCRVLGHLKEPLLAPIPAEREGYVPNVVYSCGSMIVGDHLVLPYGFADVGASIATIRVEDLLNRLTRRS